MRKGAEKIYVPLFRLRQALALGLPAVNLASPRHRRRSARGVSRIAGILSGMRPNVRASATHSRSWDSGDIPVTGEPLPQ